VLEVVLLRVSSPKNETSVIYSPSCHSNTNKRLSFFFIHQHKWEISVVDSLAGSAPIYSAVVCCPQFESRLKELSWSHTLSLSSFLISVPPFKIHCNKFWCFKTFINTFEKKSIWIEQFNLIKFSEESRLLYLVNRFSLGFIHI